MGKDYQQLWNDITNGPETAGAVPALGKILADKKGRDFILGLGREDAKLCMDLSDKVSCDLHLLLLPPHTVLQGITEPNLKPGEKHFFFVTLRRLAERYGRLPERVMITENLEVQDKILAFGGSGIVREGRYKGDRVAVKTLKIPPGVFEKVSSSGSFVPTCCAVSTILPQRFFREVVLWSTLSHPNILKLVGVHEDTKKREFSTVSEWMGGGNIMEFINGNHANRLELVNGFLFLPCFIR